MTYRVQNECARCEYTWYPRGSDISRRCPACKSPRVRVAPHPLDLPLDDGERRARRVLLLAFAVAFVLVGLLCAGLLGVSLVSGPFSEGLREGLEQGPHAGEPPPPGVTKKVR